MSIRDFHRKYKSVSCSMQCLILTSRWRKGVHQYFMHSHLRSFFPTSGLFALSSHFLGCFFGIRLTVKTLHRLVTVVDMPVFSILHCHHLQILSMCLAEVSSYLLALRDFCFEVSHHMDQNQNSSAQPANQVALQIHLTHPPQKMLNPGKRSEQSQQ